MDVRTRSGRADRAHAKYYAAMEQGNQHRSNHLETCLHVEERRRQRGDKVHHGLDCRRAEHPRVWGGDIGPSHQVLMVNHTNARVVTVHIVRLLVVGNQKDATSELKVLLDGAQPYSRGWKKRSRPS